VSPGFVPSQQFSGLENLEKQVALAVAVLPSAYEDEPLKMFKKKAASRGMEVLKAEKITINGSNASIYEVRQTQNGIVGNKLMLIFGDSVQTVFAVGSYPPKDIEVAEDVKKMLLSIKPSDTLNQIALGNYEISLEETPLKFAYNLLGKSEIYTVDGKQKPDPNDPLFNTIKVIEEVPENNRKQISLNTFKQALKEETIKIVSNNPVWIDGLPGYEIIGYEMNGETQVTAHLAVILFSYKNEVFLLMGHAKKNMEENLVMFRNITKSFKRTNK
jgi:hypothetical protein